jgi:TonB family protein
MLMLLLCALLNLEMMQAQAKIAPQDAVPVDALPKLLTRVEPIYPREAREKGIEGKVFVQLVVNPDGRVSEASVLKSDAEIFNQAALDAARKYTFTPAMKNQPAVPVKVVIPFQFKLSAKGSDGTHARSYPIFSLIENLLYGPIDSSVLAGVTPGATLILQNKTNNLRWELLNGNTLRSEKSQTVYKELHSDEGAPTATVVLITEGKARRYHTVTLVRGDDQKWRVRLWHCSE